MIVHPVRILVVDDDSIVAESVADFLKGCGYDATFATSGEEAIGTIEHAEHAVARLQKTDSTRVLGRFAVVVTDMAMPGMSGLDLIQKLRQAHPSIVPIVFTGYGTIEAAVKSIRFGAVDYLTKPLVDEELKMAVEKAVQRHALVVENFKYRGQLDEQESLHDIVGSDEQMRKIYDVIAAVAPSKTTVLMCGESGTGKSLIARAIHRNSPRADKPFVEISCGSIPETLLESDLFGHVKGAFTGAHAKKAGRFLAAHTGTLFLDEINSASPGMQLKLLRALQERTFEPVGSNDSVEVDVRVILASNQPLEELVASGQFRQDLYYRINVVSIHLPPLRERLHDVPQLAEHFRIIKSQDAAKHVIGFTDQAMEALCTYDYPGNVRELENLIERAVVLTKTTKITIDDFPDHVIAKRKSSESPQPELRLAPAAGRIGCSLHKALEEPEKQIILAALQTNNWNRQKTAAQLDINRTTLYKKIKQYDLEEYGETG
jgi:DNA-binding NtrC family response regulator